MSDLQRKKISFLIGAAHSGGGKTTFSSGLMRALSNRGVSVQPFKCGPDYIDPMYHRIATGNDSVNLDLWMASRKHVKEVFDGYSSNFDAAIVEGVMGLFDGAERDQGSSADLARTLQIPVVLIVDAQATAFSMAPILYGFKHFDPSLNLAGVVFNKIGSEQHYRMVCEAADAVGVRSFGYLPKMNGLNMPSRHLGLSVDNFNAIDQVLTTASEAIEKYVDLDALQELCIASDAICRQISIERGELKIAVARDEAFNFIYRENLDRLKTKGDVCFFSPISDSELPACDLLYLPGGYPEFYAEKLSSNQSMIDSIKEYAERGGALFAECGGMMYLCRALDGMEGKRYPMVNLFPLEVSMQNMRLHLGYRKFRLNGVEFRGHEFHFSSVSSGTFSSIAQLYSSGNEAVATPLYRYKNAIAGYTHLYWGETDILKLWN